MAITDLQMVIWVGINGGVFVSCFKTLFYQEFGLWYSELKCESEAEGKLLKDLCFV
jgi:hypothetical protein